MLDWSIDVLVSLKRQEKRYTSNALRRAHVSTNRRLACCRRGGGVTDGGGAVDHRYGRDGEAAHHQVLSSYQNADWVVILVVLTNTSCLSL